MKKIVLSVNAKYCHGCNTDLLSPGLSASYESPPGTPGAWVIVDWTERTLAMASTPALAESVGTTQPFIVVLTVVREIGSGIGRVYCGGAFNGSSSDYE